MSRRISADAVPDGHPALQFLLGATPFFALGSDPRFSYSLYVPTRYRELPHPLPLLVAVHGTGRSVERTRDTFRELAEGTGMAVLAPLFPGGIADSNDLDAYKAISSGGIRYDRVLLDMVDEAAERWSLDTSRVLLAGFSGGGQFSLRFTLLHPDRVRAVSIGAPGRVTLVDDEPWPHGIGDVADVFDAPVDREALRRVVAQVVVGADDDARELLAAVAADPLEARAGAGRVDRARSLAASLSEAVEQVRLDVVPGVAHDSAGVASTVIAFLREELAG